MQTTTQEIIRAALRADPGLSVTDRNNILAAMRDHGKGKGSSMPAPRLLRRAEAAARLGVSTRAIDLWTQEGILQKIRLPGRRRAAGFAEESISALIKGE